MFDEYGQMRSTNKSVLKSSLQVVIGRRVFIPDIEMYFIDGCALLWVVQWPKDDNATVQDYIRAFRKLLEDIYLSRAEVYLIFDRYIRRSLKQMLRWKRDKGASRVFQLKCESALPKRELLLGVTANKI